MLKAKNQYYYNEEASQFHEAFRQILITDPRLKQLRCYQEVNVQDLIPSYEYPGHHFDWFISEWNVIVELHGAQHYKLTNFGNVAAEDALINFRSMQFRDNAKATAAKEAGFSYIIIPYKWKHKLSYDVLIELMKEQE